MHRNEGGPGLVVSYGCVWAGGEYVLCAVGQVHEYDEEGRTVVFGGYDSEVSELNIYVDELRIA